jgi:uroporphyrin-III C-methyltransferase
VTFITGHASDGEVPDGLDWPALAKGAPVLVLYMALKHLDAIAKRLIAGGRKPDEPVAVVSKATTAAQRVLETTLARAAADVAAAAIEPPAIIAVGEAVKLRGRLDWLGALADSAPLSAR